MVEILLVDDDPGLIYMLERILKKEGYSTESVNSGDECLKKLKNKTFDLILLDVMMPGLNGWETLTKIREDSGTSDIPVIMVTVKSSEEDKDSSYQRMADGHIDKPIEKQDLLATIYWTLNPEFGD